MVEELLNLKTMRMPTDIARDMKKLTKFLSDFTEQYNKLIKGIAKFNRLTAAELIARPTYAEEFQNIRENVHKVVVPNDPEAWMKSQYSQLSDESRVF